jgi:ubiquinone biosynthesis O-methyltransferase
MQFEISYRINDRDKVQQYLDQLYDYQDLSTRVFHRKRLNLIYKTVDKLIRQKKINTGGSALDIGCNQGFCSRIISNLGFRDVLGIDITEDAIEQANRNFAVDSAGKKLSYQCIAAEKLTMMNKKYDFILCTEVIEHVNDPHQVVENIRSLLSEKGLALISLPNRISLNYFSLVIGKKLLGRPFSADLRQHLQYPFYRSLKTFRNNGFEVVRTTGTNLFLLDSILKFVVRFPPVLQFDSFLAGIFPFKYFSQFFFMTLRIKNGKK